MKALSRAFILENPDSTLDPKIIPKQCLMELVTPNEASTINEAFERAKKLKKRGLQTQATQSVRREILQAFPKESQRQEEGAALESTQKPGRARGDCVAFSQYTQLDIIGGGRVPGQVAHIVRFGFLQECRLEQARLAARV